MRFSAMMLDKPDEIVKMVKAHCNTPNYLIFEDSESPYENIMKLNAFDGDHGFIVVTSMENELAACVKRHCELNSHADFVSVMTGYNADDFVYARKSANIKFKFKQNETTVKNETDNS